MNRFVRAAVNGKAEGSNPSLGAVVGYIRKVTFSQLNCGSSRKGENPQPQ